MQLREKSHLNKNHIFMFWFLVVSTNLQQFFLNMALKEVKDCSIGFRGFP